MVKILSEGDGKHRVEADRDEQIGWISGRTIGFRGFATEEDARSAAISARRALDRALQAQYAGWPAGDANLERLHLVHDGAYEWFYDGTTAIARLLRPHRRAYDASFGIELVLPSFANEGVSVAAAYAVSFAIEPYRDVAPIEHRAAGVPRADGIVPDTSTFY